MKKLLPTLLGLSVLFLAACTKDFGTVEVTYQKATAVYGDLEEQRDLPLLAEARPIENAGKVFVAPDMLLIGEEGTGIHIVDNSDPKNPVNLSFVQIPGNREFYVDGITLYAESLYDMLKLDISDMNNPKLISRVKDAFADSQNFQDNDGNTLLKFDFEEVTEKVTEDSEIYQQLWGHQEVYYFDFASKIIPPSQVPVSFAGNSSASVGSVNRIAVVDEYVYVISRDFITTFEDNGELTAKNTSYGFGNLETIYPNGDRLFLGTAQSMEIYSIADPSNPEWQHSFSHATSCDPVLPCGEVAYVTLRTGDVGNCPGDVNALLVVDLSNTIPEELQEIEMQSPYGMTVINNRLYVGEGSNGLKIFDISDKENIELERWEREIEAYDIIYHPTEPNLLLVAGPVGISQYQIEGGVDYSLLSVLNF